MATEQVAAVAAVTSTTPDLSTAVLGLKVDNLQKSVDEMHADVKAMLAQQARHDERITSLEDKGKWAGGILAACMAYVLTKIGLPIR